MLGLNSFRFLRFRVAGESGTFQVAVYDGVCADSLSRAVAARAAVPQEAFYCTATQEADGPVVPLSAALVAAIPDTVVLTVHMKVTPVPTPPVRAFHSSMDLPTITEPPMTGQVFGPKSREEAPLHTCTVPLLRMNRVQQLETLSQQTGQMVTAMERFNRLATDLANERTLLAWIRTAMAGIRTVFVFYAIDGVNTLWDYGVSASEILMAVLVLVLLFTGRSRYYAIKELILKREPPATFGRISLRYTYIVLALATFTTTLGVCSRRWQKIQ
ncbi:unnamed protein product [Effrenium voratum]|uniref:DUF202 domain-containing protein n=1 Tax=Effrenium voratum TaxID=2562239 RepID=A0AA36NHA0_9DINO|nr:unnamed protein product [Effrenium voratum]